MQQSKQLLRINFYDLLSDNPIVFSLNFVQQKDKKKTTVEKTQQKQMTYTQIWYLL